MSNVPPGASGIASGILNASRQVGTCIGLAVLGSVGVGATASAWHERIAALPNSAIGRSLTRDVAGGQLDPVRQRLGASGAR